MRRILHSQGGMEIRKRLPIARLEEGSGRPLDAVAISALVTSVVAAPRGRHPLAQRALDVVSQQLGFL